MKVEVFRCDHPHKRTYAAEFQISYTTPDGEMETVDVCRGHLGGSVLDVLVGQAIGYLAVEAISNPTTSSDAYLCEYKGCVRVFGTEHARTMHYVKAHGYRRGDG